MGRKQRVCTIRAKNYNSAMKLVRKKYGSKTKVVYKLRLIPFKEPVKGKKLYMFWLKKRKR